MSTSATKRAASRKAPAKAPAKAPTKASTKAPSKAPVKAPSKAPGKPPKKAAADAPKGSTKQAAPAKPGKTKLVRDSFTIPKPEYEALHALKERAAKLARPTKKSELLRAGIALLATQTDKAFLAALAAVPSLKTGRPKGDAKD